MEQKNRQTEPQKPVVWIHSASAGEFEQAMPIILALRETYGDGIRIVLTFFSPSGYEPNQHNKCADEILYLPLDSKKNAQKLIKHINPTVAIFIKYEFWYHYFNQLKQQNVRLLVVSTVFRSSQYFFRPLTKRFGKATLACVNHFFVQNESSKQGLATLGFTNATVSGDTRFERVVELSWQQVENKLMNRFCQNASVVVAGSTWRADENLLIETLSLLPKNFKLMLIPHEVNENNLKRLKKSIKNALFYSQIDKNTDIEKHNVLIVDKVGMLSKLYFWAKYSFVGGGFDKGIHNTLEAAVYGRPLFFGINYKKFEEAKTMIEQQSAFSVSDSGQLRREIMRLEADGLARQGIKIRQKQYINSSLGATKKILEYLEPLLCVDI